MLRAGPNSAASLVCDPSKGGICNADVPCSTLNGELFELYFKLNFQSGYVFSPLASFAVE